MNYTPILVIIRYLVLTHLIARYIGAKRKIGYGRLVLLSILFSPVIGYIFTVLSKPIEGKKAG